MTRTGASIAFLRLGVVRDPRVINVAAQLIQKAYRRARRRHEAAVAESVDARLAHVRLAVAASRIQKAYRRRKMGRRLRAARVIQRAFRRQHGPRVAGDLPVDA